MRLINCETLQFEEFLGYEFPPYAILSHTWGGEEVTFAEYNSDVALASSSRTRASKSKAKAATTKEGYKKIKFACGKALQHSLKYVWVDTCCIDKSSSAELTEAINSMFQWYRKADVCYVYLSDVCLQGFDEEFTNSRWFRRGWTLQELIAPDRVEFYDCECEYLGEKSQFIRWISWITGIDEKALSGIDDSKGGLGAYCVARRMSWAADRETTRLEDRAYSLLGIFNVHMPLLYGEGHMAFIRLQEEIIKISDDGSIFAWGLETETEEPIGATGTIPKKAMISLSGLIVRSEILSWSPGGFRNSRHLQHGAVSKSPFSLTNVGLDIELLLVTIPSPPGYCPDSEPKDVLGWIGLLNCRAPSDSDLESQFVAILLSPSRNGIEGQYERVQIGRRTLREIDTCPLTQTMLVGERVAMQAVPKRITIVRGNDSESARWSFFDVRKFVVNESPALQAMGYSATSASRIEWWETKQHPEEVVEWNTKTKILTAADPVIGADFYRFVFESSKDLPAFVVLAYDSSAIVRSTTTFTIEENRWFQKFLEKSSQDEDTGDVTFSAGHERFKIVVGVTVKMLAHWKVFEVNVGVVFVEASSILEGAMCGS